MVFVFGELSDFFEKFESNKVSSLLIWTFLKIRQYRTWILSCFLQFTKLHSSIRIQVQIVKNSNDSDEIKFYLTGTFSK